MLISRTTQGDYSMIGRGIINLSPLLRTKPFIKLVDFPVTSMDRPGELIGHVTLEMRLALPISELYNLFLERNPLEKEAIKQAARVHPLQDETTGWSKTKWLWLLPRVQ